MIKYLKYLGHYWWQVILLLGGLSLQVWSSLQLPDMMGQIVNQGIVAGDQDFIYSEGLMMLLVTLAGGVGAVIAGFFASRVGSGLSARVREDTFNKVLSFSPNEMNKFSTSSLITRSTNDINQVQQVTIMMLRICFQAPMMGIGAVVMAFNTAPDMAWIIAMGVGVLLTVMTTVLVFALPKFRLMQKLIDKINLVVRENLTGIRVVRAFNNEKYEQNKFEGVNDELARTNRFVFRTMAIVFPVVQLVMNAMTLLVIWIGARYVDNGAVEVGNLMAFMQYAMQVMMSFMFVTMAFIMVPRAMVSWQRIAEVLKTNSTVVFPEKSIGKPNKNLRGVVEFRDVSFTYPDADEPILESISFTAKPGQTTAFIGSTGSGKSTLINLIPRLYDATGGKVLINGIDVRDYSARDLFAKIGYVPQKGILFSGTVKSNVGYGMKNKDDKQIARAIRIAQGQNFVKRMDGGQNAEIAQGGKNVSGGQRQRLSIARAIAKNPEIYIFDDSFSALDFRTDRNLRDALKKETGDATIVMVAQRIGTIKNADQIVVLDNGRVAGIGKHRDLLNDCKVYREIAKSQLSEAEINSEMKK